MSLSLGDCLEVMQEIPDASIDLVLTDPPYNIGKAKWDKIKNYIEWCGEWVQECGRILKPNGSFYFWHNDMVQIAQLMEWIRQNTEFEFKQLITWSKINSHFKNYGFVQQRLSVDGMRNYYNGFTEYCLFYTFQDGTGLEKVKLDIANFATLRNYFKILFKWIGLTKNEILDLVGQSADHCFRWGSTQWGLPTAETYARMTDLFDLRKCSEFREYESLRKEYESIRYTFNVSNVKSDLRANSNVWLYPPDNESVHITPKPVDMLENIIQHSSNPDGVVLDCFMGGGSTGVACINTGRKFIGIELDENYFRIAKNRIEEAQHIVDKEEENTQDVVCL